MIEAGACPLPLSLRTAAHVALLAEEAALNFRIDLVQPLLGALGLLPICFNLGLKLCDTILGGAELVRQLLRRIDRMSAVLLGNISSFAQKLEDGLTGFIELIATVSRSLSRSCKWYHFGAHC